MNASTFDALAAAEALEAAGLDRAHAKAIATEMRKAALADRDELATKADLARLRNELRADLYRALWIQGAGIVAILTALRFLPIRSRPFTSFVRRNDIR